MPSPAPSSPMKSATICTDGLPPAIAIRGGGGNDTNGGDGFNPHQLQGSPSGSGQQHHHPHHPHGGLPAVVHSPNPSSNANDGTLTTAPFAPPAQGTGMNHRGFGSATAHTNDNAMSGNPGEAPTTAMLDACIRDLSRRRMAMAQQAAATSRAVAGMGGSNHSLPLPSRGGGGSTGGLPGGMGGSGMPSGGPRSSVAAAAMGLPPEPPAGAGKGGTVLADYAGKAADSFAQAFVDRWASAHSKDPAGGGVPVMGPGGVPGPSLGAAQPLQDGSYHSLPSGGSAKGTPRRGSSSGSGEKQWFVCDHCKTKAFVSRHELRQHEAKCEMRGMAMGPGMPGSMMGPGMMGPGMMAAGSMHSLDRGASLGSSHHSMGQPPRGPMPAFLGMPPGMPPGMPHPGMAMPPGMPPGMHPYMGMMYGDPSAASGMMMPPHMASGAFPGMPGAMPSVSEANAAANETSGRQRRKPAATVISPELIEASKGPFRTLPKPMALSLDDDKDWLTPLHCFVRRNCVEVFTATETDVQTPSKGKRKPIQVGQIGIRCPHCHKGRRDTDPNRERGSVYYPTSLGSIYNATMNLLQRHLHSCPRVPKEVMERYAELKRDDARSGTSKKYWIESARSLGFVDTLQGIKLSDKKAPRLGMDWDGKKEDGEKEEGKTEAKDGKEKAEDESEKKDGDEKEDDGENKEGDEKEGAKKEGGDGNDEAEEEKKDGKEKKKEEPAEAPPLVIPADKSTATEFSFLLLSQMQPCVFTEADRLGKRKGLPTGFAGLACRHCFGCYGSGRFFPSSIKTLSDTSKTLNVLHNHMARCRKVPPETLEQLETARATHDDERAKMKFGSQKAFFAKIWSRLHDNRPDGMVIRPPQRQPSKTNPNGGMRRLSTSGSAGAAPPVHNPHMMRMMAGGMGMYPMMMGGGAGGAPMPGMDPAQMQMMGYPMMGYPMMGPGGMPPGMGPGGMGGAPGGMPPQQGGQGDFKRPHESANEAMRKRMKHNADV